MLYHRTHTVYRDGLYHSQCYGISEWTSTKFKGVKYKLTFEIRNKYNEVVENIKECFVSKIDAVKRYMEIKSEWDLLTIYELKNYLSTINTRSNYINELKEN